MERSRQSWNRSPSLRTLARDDGAMKRSTAISRLSDVADGLERAKVWPEPCIIAGYVFGALLDPAGDLERVQLALVVDEPSDDVPWMSRPRHLEAVASLLRFDKLPVSWCWRPTAWPVWNRENYTRGLLLVCGDRLQPSSVRRTVGWSRRQPGTRWAH